MDLADIEAKLKKIQLLKEMEHTFACIDASVKNGGIVNAIVAEDASESERSVRFEFTSEESRTIFIAAKDALATRYNAFKLEIGE